MQAKKAITKRKTGPRLSNAGTRGFRISWLVLFLLLLLALVAIALPGHAREAKHQDIQREVCNRCLPGSPSMPSPPSRSSQKSYGLAGRAKVLAGRGNDQEHGQLPSTDAAGRKQ